MGTLQVQEAMGMKVDREAVATLVLPQLWVMAMGPRACLLTSSPHISLVLTLDVHWRSTVLNVDQFTRFMGVIKKLGERVEKEHNQYLRDSQRHEDRSAMTVNGSGAGSSAFGQPVDFESLVAGASGTVKADNPGAGVGMDSMAMTGGTGAGGGTDWSDDVWGSILASPTEVCLFLPVISADIDGRTERLFIVFWVCNAGFTSTQPHLTLPLRKPIFFILLPRSYTHPPAPTPIAPSNSPHTTTYNLQLELYPHHTKHAQPHTLLLLHIFFFTNGTRQRPTRRQTDPFVLVQRRCVPSSACIRPIDAFITT